MSEPIIIETPQPPVRERLILVREGEPLAPRRDATPEDLERAGWVPLSAFVGPLDLLSPPTLEGALEAIRDFLRERNEELEAHLLSEQRLDRALDEARSERAEADGLLVQRETELRLAREAHDAAKASEVVWAGRARDAERERDEAMRRLEEREADMHARIRAGYDRTVADSWRAEVAKVTARAEKAERERDEDDRVSLEAEARSEEIGRVAERARVVASLRAAAERARRLPPEDCSGPWPHGAAVGAHLDLEADRLERGDHAGTPVLPRATDEELADAYNEAFHAHAGDVSASRLAAVRAVAARVRREQCLVTRAVEAGYDLEVVEETSHPEHPSWRVLISGETRARELAAPADVPATLARLLDEVTRG